MSIFELDKLIDEVDGRINSMDKNTEKLVKLITQEGYQSAEYLYSNAIYSGVKTGKIEWEVKKDAECKYTGTVKATGNDVLFVEFGTGINNPEDHPEQGNFHHGEYGRGHGSNPKGWVYYGDPGNSPNATAIRQGKQGLLVRTTGEPAQAFLYNSKKRANENSKTIMKGVFK